MRSYLVLAAMFVAFVDATTAQAAQKAPVNTKHPWITGTARQGDTLTAHNGTWKNRPTRFAVQWKRDGRSVAGATHATYVLKAADVSDRVTVTVTARNASGSASATSSSTAKVVPALSPPAAPDITSGPMNGTTSTSATFTFTESTPGATLMCALDGPLGGPYALCSSGTASYSGLSLGSHTFEVDAVDAGGTSKAFWPWTIAP